MKADIYRVGGLSLVGAFLSALPVFIYSVDVRGSPGSVGSCFLLPASCCPTPLPSPFIHLAKKDLPLGILNLTVCIAHGCKCICALNKATCPSTAVDAEKVSGFNY